MRTATRVVVIALMTTAVVALSLALIEGTARLLGQGPIILPLDAWATWIAQRRWSDAVTILISASTTAAGLLLLMTQLWPRRPLGLDMARVETGQGVMDGQGDQVRGPRRFVLSSRGLEDHLRERAAQQPDVLSASVAIRRRRATIDLMVPSTAPADLRPLREAVAAEIEAEMTALDLASDLRVRVRAQRSSRRVL